MNKTGQAEVGLLQPRPCPRPLPQAPPGMLTANTSELQTGRVYVHQAHPHPSPAPITPVLTTLPRRYYFDPSLLCRWKPGHTVLSYSLLEASSSPT